ncbi:hypothetical protein [Candidatus Pyrohabitans sp.]
MISKQRLLKKFENIAELEDEGVVFITRSLRKIVEKSDLPEEKKTRILEIIDVIRKESKGHKVAVLKMMEIVRGRDKDEF